MINQVESDIAARMTERTNQKCGMTPLIPLTCGHDWD